MNNIQRIDVLYIAVHKWYVPLYEDHQSNVLTK